jgi:hypothetical protein
MYKMVGQYGVGGQRLEWKRRGQSSLEEGCEGSKSPLRAVVVVMMNFYVKHFSLYRLCDGVQRKIM